VPSLFFMELASQIDELIDVVTSCTKATFDRDVYMAMIQQSYLPPASLSYLKHHWVSQDCIRKSAAWFEKVVEKLEVNVGDLGEVHIARVGFVLTFLLLKHVLEYKYIELPGDVKGRIHTATIDLISLDVAVGHVWPIVISIGVDALYALKPLREQIERGGLRLIKRLVAPLAVFGVVSDVLHKFGFVNNYFTATGFGRMVDRLMEAILDSMYVDSLLHDVLDLLISTSRLHEEMFQDFVYIQRGFRELARGLVKRYVKSSLYTVEDAELDMAHYILAAASHYEQGDAEIRTLLHRLSWGKRVVNQQEVRELVVRYLFAKLIRAW